METNKKPDEFEQVMEELKSPKIEIEIDPFDDIDESLLGEMIPSESEQIAMVIEEEVTSIFGDNEVRSVCSEILDNCRKDRESIEQYLTNFVDMAFNDGDASSATKESIVNLSKIKSDISDKMVKVVDVMVRTKQSKKDNSPKIINQHTNIQVESSKRDLIKRIENRKKRKNESK